MQVKCTTHSFHSNRHGLLGGLEARAQEDEGGWWWACGKTMDPAALSVS